MSMTDTTLEVEIEIHLDMCCNVVHIILCSGDGAGVGKGRTIAGICIHTFSTCTVHVSVSLFLCRYYLSKLLGGQEEGCLVKLFVLFRK